MIGSRGSLVHARARLGLGLIAALATLTASAAGAPAKLAWQEHFDKPALDWVDPLAHNADEIARVYSVRHDGALAFLHARHDRASTSTPPALHYGKAFQKAPIPLDKVRALRWRWRALQHPNVTTDPWIDLAAGVYVLIRKPGVFASGRGFKFGWLALPGKPGQHQRGLLEVPLRTEAATREWKSESVDLCALYKQEYGGSCAGETIQYIGVVTDADNTRSIAEGDYADFELELN